MGSGTKNPACAGSFRYLRVAVGHRMTDGAAATQFCSRARPALRRVDDADELPVAGTFLLELDVSVLLREQRVITADADVYAGVEASAALANDDVTRDDLLATVELDA